MQFHIYFAFPNAGVIAVASYRAPIPHDISKIQNSSRLKLFSSKTRTILCLFVVMYSDFNQKCCFFTTKAPLYVPFHRKCLTRLEIGATIAPLSAVSKTISVLFLSW